MKVALLVTGLKGALTIELLPRGIDFTSVYYYKSGGEHPSAHERLVEALEGRATEVDPRTPISLEQYDIVISLGWQYLIPNPSNLVVLHDSLLPRYRGFAPTVTALIRGETSLGVTAIRAVSEVDAGPILSQHRTEVASPVSIQQAFESLASCYVACIEDVLRIGPEGLDNGMSQSDSDSTYSIWRDSLDYSVDWDLSAIEIHRHALAVGYPYGGARTTINGIELRIDSTEVIEDMNFEIRQPGKIWKVHAGNCVDVVCGKGMLRVVLSNPDNPSQSPIKRLRTRLG